MKVWTLGDMLLPNECRPGAKTIPAGACLLVSEDQTNTPDGHIQVVGLGCRAVVSLEWLTFDPALISTLTTYTNGY